MICPRCKQWMPDFSVAHPQGCGLTSQNLTERERVEGWGKGTEPGFVIPDEGQSSEGTDSGEIDEAKLRSTTDGQEEGGSE